MGGLHNPPFADFLSERQMLKTFLRLHYSPPDFSSAVTGTGVVALNGFEADVRSGATAASDARAYTEVDGLHPAQTVGGRVNFDYPLLFACWFYVTTSNAAFTRYVQFKAATTHGILAASGLGIEVANLAATGETYGAARSTVALGSLTAGRPYKLLVAHYPGVKVEFWLDGALSGTITTTANIPSGDSSTKRHILASAGNGAASASAVLIAGGFQIVQKATT